MKEHLSLSVCVCVRATSTSHAHKDCRMQVLVFFSLLCCTLVMEFQLIESIQYTRRKIVKIIFYCTEKCTFANKKKNSLQTFIHTPFTLIRNDFLCYFIYVQVFIFIIINLLGGILFFNLFDFYLCIWFGCDWKRNRVDEICVELVSSVCFTI